MLKKCLLGLGFEQCLADSCVFRLIEGGEIVMLLVVHVDDIFAVGKKDRGVINLERISTSLCP